MKFGMNKLSLALRTIKKRPFICALIVIELAAVFLAVNYMTSAIAERGMLSAPFDDILNENSAFVFDEEALKDMQHGVHAAAELSRERLLSGVSGGYVCCDVLTYIASDIRIISVSDRVFARLRFPLASGSGKGALGSYYLRTGTQTFDLGGKALTYRVSENDTSIFSLRGGGRGCAKFG